MSEQDGKHIDKGSFPKLKTVIAVKRAALFDDNCFWRIDGTNTAAYLLPIRLTMIYLIASVLVYAFGPFEWTTYAPGLFYALLVLYMVALWFGYRVGLMRKFSNAIEWKSGYTEKAMGVLSILVVVNLAAYIVNIFREYGFTTFDFPGLLKQMSIGIRDPGLGYNLRLERIMYGQGGKILGGTLFTLFNYCWSFVRYPTMIFSMIYFKRMNIMGKIFAVIYLAVMVLFYLSIGTNIDVFHVFLLLEMKPLLDVFSSWHKKEITKRKVLKLTASILAGFLFIGCYFTWMMISRGSINAYEEPEYNISGVQLSDKITGREPTVPPTEAPTVPPTEAPTVPPTEIPGDPSQEKPEDNKLAELFKKFWISFSAYFAQGYYGMTQGITLPWTPMFGVGNSMFLVDFLSEHVYDIDQFTYQMKIEQAYGWESDMRWHSMYTWLANDVSFYGVIVVMFLIGVLFAMMFKDAITTENPFSKASIFYFVLMVFFIPCNNQIGQRSDTLLSFLLLVFCWLLTKHPPKFLKKWLSK